MLTLFNLGAKIFESQRKSNFYKGVCDVKYK